MTLDPQTVIAAIIVLACAIYTIRKITKPFTSKGEAGCGGDCSCEAAKKPTDSNTPSI